ncbi:MAG: hypothetical protein AAFQ43_09685, partial [Bacteroidota bacterium]
DAHAVPRRAEGVRGARKKVHAGWWVGSPEAVSPGASGARGYPGSAAGFGSGVRQIVTAGGRWRHRPNAGVG